MSKRKLLPLDEDDPRWIPLSEAHAARAKQVGDDVLAARDLTEGLRKGDIHSMYRRRWPPDHAWGVYQGEGPPPPERTLQSQVFWRDHEVHGFTGDVFVSPHLPTSNYLKPLDFAFFIWLPEYKKNFGDPQGDSSLLVQTQQMLEKRGRRASPIWPKIGAEFARRIGELGSVAANKSVNSWATDLDQWCISNNLNPPGSTALREYIDNVLKALFKRK